MAGSDFTIDFFFSSPQLSEKFVTGNGSLNDVGLHHHLEKREKKNNFSKYSISLTVPILVFQYILKQSTCYSIESLKKNHNASLSSITIGLLQVKKKILI